MATTPLCSCPPFMVAYRLNSWVDRNMPLVFTMADTSQSTRLLLKPAPANIPAMSVTADTACARQVGHA